MALLIPQDILDEILSRLDPVSFISEYVTLKKSGKDFKGLCPFHQEKTPSFWVSPDKRIFYCFGCSEGGNLFKFLMKLENLSFPEAAEKLARRAGVALKTRDEGEERESDRREILYRINRYAAWFFEEQLKGRAGEAAARYLAGRGLAPETVQEFHLGCAPDDWEGLTGFLREKKVPLESAEALGLIRKRKDGSYYDFFRNRLMFPIMDEQSRVIGFGGRRLNDASKEDAKYINSPESPIYHKGEGVYGLAQTKKAIREKGEVILVEGYMDLIALYQAGVRNTAAPLGTALTPQQISVLTRFAPGFVLMFDGDEAGKRAFLRSLRLCLGAGYHPKVVALPLGQDPDSFVREKGAEAMQQEVAQAKPAVEWIIVKALSGVGSQPSSRMEAVHRVLPYVQELPSVVEQKGYLARLAQFLGLGEEGFRELVTRGSPKGPESGVNRPKSKKISLERNLLQLYVVYPHLVHGSVSDDFFCNFEDDELRELGALLYRHYQSSGSLPLDRLSALDGRFDGNTLSELAFEKIPISSEEELKTYIQDCLSQWRKSRLKRELKALTGEIQLAEMKNDAGLLRELLARKNQTLISLRELG